MGTWGAGIFDDDVASDARDDWERLLKEGVAPAAASTEVLDRYGKDDPVVILALAATEWRWGRLENHLKAKALSVLRDGSALTGWNNDPARARRLKALDVKLRNAPPAPRRVRVRTAIQDWVPGEIVGWRVMDGRWALMRVVARTASYGRSVSPTFELLDWYDPKLPSKRSIRALGLRSAVTAGHGMPRVLGGQPLFTLGAFEPGEFPQQRLRRLGVHAELLRPRSGSGVELRWRDLDDFLASRFGMGFTVGTLIALRATSGTLFIMLVRNTAWESESDLLLDVDVLEWRRRTIPKPAEFARLNTRPSRKFPHWLMGVRWSGGSKHRNGCPL